MRLLSPLLLVVAASCGNYDPSARLIRTSIAQLEDVSVEPPGVDRQALENEIDAAGNQTAQAMAVTRCQPGTLEFRLPRCQAIRIANIFNISTITLLKIVDRLLEEPVTHRIDGRRVWGAFNIPGADASLRLDAERLADGSVSYCVHVSPRRLRRGAGRNLTCADEVDEATGLTLVIVGDVDAGNDSVASGTGSLLVFNNTLAALGDNEARLGTWTIRYQNREAEDRSVNIEIEGAEGDNEVETESSYAFTRFAAGGGTFRFRIRADADFVPNGTPDVLETYEIRARWNEENTGRADARIFGGDLDQQEATSTQCWDAAQETNYYRDNQRELGNENNCLFGEPLPEV